MTLSIAIQNSLTIRICQSVNNLVGYPRNGGRWKGKTMHSINATKHGFAVCQRLMTQFHYKDIIERPNAYSSKEALFFYQWQTKAKEWEYEQEVRLVMPKPTSIYAALTPAQAEHPKEMWDWREIHHYMPLKGDCFESIYFGVNTETSEKEKIVRYVREKLNPQIRLYQMRVDENAFRLHADNI